MARYVCKSCNYRFERDKKPNVCPYCGEKAVRCEETAEELIEDIS
jgi:rubrerythrin